MASRVALTMVTTEVDRDDVGRYGVVQVGGDGGARAEQAVGEPRGEVALGGLGAAIPAGRIDPGRRAVPRR
jgi:hypothetical protein